MQEKEYFIYYFQLVITDTKNENEQNYTNETIINILSNRELINQ